MGFWGLGISNLLNEMYWTAPLGPAWGASPTAPRRRRLSRDSALDARSIATRITPLIGNVGSDERWPNVLKISGNHKPGLRAVDEAIRRRLTYILRAHALYVGNLRMCPMCPAASLNSASQGLWCKSRNQL